MSEVVSSTVFINGIPVEFLFPWEITFSRGAEPSEARFQCRDDRFDAKLEEEITIEIVCSGTDSTTEDKIKIKRWFVKSKKQVSFGVTEYTIADIRHVLSYFALTKSYNIFSYGGQYRLSSLKNQTTQWRAQEAAVDAIETICDGNIEIKIGVDREVSFEYLPDNLGNSLGGGWFGAKMIEFLPPMLEAIRADLVVDWNGELSITDRKSKTSKDFKKHILLSGVAGPRDLHWQRPQKIQVLFEQRIERRFDYVQGRSQTPNNGLEIENVITDLEITPDGADVAFDPDAEPSFMLMSDFLASFGLTDARVAEHFTKPLLFNLESDKTLTGAQKIARLAADVHIRRFWRRLYRVKDDTSSGGNIRKVFADIQLGRLKEDGTTRAQENVNCHFCEVLRIGIPNPNAQGGDPREARFSSNHDSTGNASENAPFIPRWVSQKDMVFMLEENAEMQKISVKHVYLGHFSNPIRVGSIKDILNGKLDFESSVGLRRDFTLRVFYNALLAAPHAPIPDGVAQGNRASIKGRVYVKEFDAFSDGKIPVLQTRVSDMTANWRFKSDSQWPGELLNEAALNVRAQFIADQIKESYEQERAGTLTFGGVNILTKGKVRPFGEVFEVKVKIGGKTPYDISTEVTILPEVIPPMNKPKQGVKPEMVL